jgi:hypothetical protein
MLTKKKKKKLFIIPCSNTFWDINLYWIGPFIIIYVAVAAHWVAYVYLSSHEGRHLSLSMKLSSTKENGWKAVGIFLGKVGFD